MGTFTKVQHSMPTENKSTKVKALRGDSTNVHHYAWEVLYDESSRHTGAAIRLIFGPARQWHTAQSKPIGSTMEYASWFAQQVAGLYYDHVRATLAVLADPVFLCQVGFSARAALASAPVDLADPGVVLRGGSRSNFWRACPKRPRTTRCWNASVLAGRTPFSPPTLGPIIETSQSN